MKQAKRLESQKFKATKKCCLLVLGTQTLLRTVLVFVFQKEYIQNYIFQIKIQARNSSSIILML